MITGKQVKEAMITKNINIVDHHNCSICGEMVFYSREGDNLYFNSSCGCCLSSSPPQPREWEDAANWINMQGTKDMQLEIANKFGLEEL